MKVCFTYVLVFAVKMFTSYCAFLHCVKYSQKQTMQHTIRNVTVEIAAPKPISGGAPVSELNEVR